MVDRNFQGVVTGADLIFRCRDAGVDPDDPRLRLVTPMSDGENGPVMSVERDALRGRT
jgi:hypothetical protein